MLFRFEGRSRWVVAEGCSVFWGPPSCQAAPVRRSRHLPPRWRRWLPRPLPSAQLSQSLSFDAASRTVTLTMVANVPGTPSEFNYNGYTNGALVITVPRGWDVTVHCNDDPAATYAHSCTVVSGPNSKVPAFPGAS